MKAIRLSALICCLALCGCTVFNFFQAEGQSYQQLSAGYQQIRLNASTSADVLGVIGVPEYELLSQNKGVVASAGQSKKGYRSWLKMVAFDEDKSTAQRKYLFVVDEKPKVWAIEPPASLVFDCEMVLNGEVLKKPYAQEKARRIAVLKEVLKDTRKDIDEVRLDNKSIAICGMLINQAMETVLIKLDASPALAARLSEPNGVEFEHTSFDGGRIRLNIADDIATVKIRSGSALKGSDCRQPKDVNLPS